MEWHEADVWRKKRDLIWNKDYFIWPTPPTVSEGAVTFQIRGCCTQQK